MSYGNERDVEVPAVLDFVRRHADKGRRRSLLDVGAHGSHATYAPAVRDLVSGQRYSAIDKIYDAVTQTIVDEWCTGDMITRPSWERFDAVMCVSVIEHVGIKPFRTDTWREERLLMFFSLLRSARFSVLVTAPFGSGTVTNEYQCVSPDELATWSAIAGLLGFAVTPRFHLSTSPQGGAHMYREVKLSEAAERGVAGSPLAVMVLECTR